MREYMSLFHFLSHLSVLPKPEPELESESEAETETEPDLLHETLSYTAKDTLHFLIYLHYYRRSL